MSIRSGAARSTLSRRDLFRLGALSAGALGAAGLAGCSSNASGGGGALQWANWAVTLDYDDETQTYPTLERFIADTGIDVGFFEVIDDSATFYATIREQLQNDQYPGYDMFNFADDFTARVIESGEVQAFDHSLIPNMSRLAPLMTGLDYDPDNSFSMPWMGGLTGLCYNTKLYPKGVRSMDDLASPDLEGRVSVLSEMSDTIGLTLLSQGVDPSGDWGDAEFDAALAEIEERLQSGVYRQVKGGSYTQDLETGDVLAAVCWSGDVQVLNDEAGEDIFEFVIPEAGATKYVSSILLPHATDRIDDISTLIDYYYQPDVFAEVIAYTYTVPPITGVQEEMAKIDPRLAESPVLFPSDEDVKNIYNFRDLSAQETNQYVAAYNKVLGL